MSASAADQILGALAVHYRLLDAATLQRAFRKGREAGRAALQLLVDGGRLGAADLEFLRTKAKLLRSNPPPAPEPLLDLAEALGYLNAEEHARVAAQVDLGAADADYRAASYLGQHRLLTTARLVDLLERKALPLLGCRPCQRLVYPPRPSDARSPGGCPSCSGPLVAYTRIPALDLSGPPLLELTGRRIEPLADSTAPLDAPAEPQTEPSGEAQPRAPVIEFESDDLSEPAAPYARGMITQVMAADDFLPPQMRQQRPAPEPLAPPPAEAEVEVEVEVEVAPDPAAAPAPTPAATDLPVLKPGPVTSEMLLEDLRLAAPMSRINREAAEGGDAMATGAPILLDPAVLEDEPVSRGPGDLIDFEAAGWTDPTLPDLDGFPELQSHLDASGQPAPWDDPFDDWSLDLLSESPELSQISATAQARDSVIETLVLRYQLMDESRLQSVLEGWNVRIGDLASHLHDHGHLTRQAFQFVRTRTKQVMEAGGSGPIGQERGRSTLARACELGYLDGEQIDAFATERELDLIADELSILQGLFNRGALRLYQLIHLLEDRGARLHHCPTCETQVLEEDGSILEQCPRCEGTLLVITGWEDIAGASDRIPPLQRLFLQGLGAMAEAPTAEDRADASATWHGLPFHLDADDEDLPGPSLVFEPEAVAPAEEYLPLPPDHDEGLPGPSIVFEPDPAPAPTPAGAARPPSDADLPAPTFVFEPEPPAPSGRPLSDDDLPAPTFVFEPEPQALYDSPTHYDIPAAPAAPEAPAPPPAAPPPPPAAATPQAPPKRPKYDHLTVRIVHLIRRYHLIELSDLEQALAKVTRKVGLLRILDQYGYAPPEMVRFIRRRLGLDAQVVTASLAEAAHRFGYLDRLPGLPAGHTAMPVEVEVPVIAESYNRGSLPLYQLYDIYESTDIDLEWCSYCQLHYHVIGQSTQKQLVCARCDSDLEPIVGPRAKRDPRKPLPRFNKLRMHMLRTESSASIAAVDVSLPQVALPDAGTLAAQLAEQYGVLSNADIVRVLFKHQEEGREQHPLIRYMADDGWINDMQAEFLGRKCKQLLSGTPDPYPDTIRSVTELATAKGYVNRSRWMRLKVQSGAPTSDDGEAAMAGFMFNRGALDFYQVIDLVEAAGVLLLTCPGCQEQLQLDEPEPERDYPCPICWQPLTALTIPPGRVPRLVKIPKIEHFIVRRMAARELPELG